ncbi:MAG: hypothetical protein ACI8TQ_003610 [Planctomycetota bacterium]|jgi:hypothetical protein
MVDKTRTPRAIPPLVKWSGRAGLLLAGLLLAELVFRLYLTRTGNGYDSALVRAEIEERVAPLRFEVGGVEPGMENWGARGRFLNPFYGYETKRGDNRIKLDLSIDQVGWDVAFPDIERPYKILVTGGSVSELFCSKDTNGTQRLTELLAEDPRFEGRTPVFLNHGRPGFKQPQQLMLLAYLTSMGLRPDAVLNIDGFNELSLGALNSSHGSNPIFPHFYYWGHLASGIEHTGPGAELASGRRSLKVSALDLGTLVLDWGLNSSAAVGSATLVRLKQLQRKWVAAADEYAQRLESETDQRVTRGMAFDADEGAVLKAIVDTWVESSQSLNALCLSKGIFYLHILQPTLHDRGSKVLTPKELEEGETILESKRAIEAGYPMLRNAAPRLEALGVPFVDASMIFRNVSERIYYDLCHFRVPGNDYLAEAIAVGFLRYMPEKLMR